MKRSIFLIGLVVLSLHIQAQTPPSVTDEVKRYVARAKTAYSMGNYQDALTEYQKAQQLVPNYPDLYKAIGDVYEQLKGVDDLKAAIDSYNRYLQLSPNATDKEDIRNKISALEYKYEKAVQQTKILDDLSGIWVSDLRSPYDNYIPEVILKIEEIQKTGKYRIGFYAYNADNFQGQILEMIPNKDYSFQVTFESSQSYSYTYTPSQSKYDLLRLGASLLGGGDIVQSAANVGISAVQEKDVPSSSTTTTKTVQDFQLKYVGGKLTGSYNNAKTTLKDNNGQIIDKKKDIIFSKNNHFAEEMTQHMEQLATNSQIKTLKNIDINTLEGIDFDYFKNNFPNLYQEFHSAKNKSNTALWGGVIVGSLIGSVALLPFSLTDVEFVQNNKILCYIVGGAGFVGGLTISIAGSAHYEKKMKTVLNQYRQELEKKRNQTSLNLGITPSGNLGLTLNF